MQREVVKRAKEYLALKGGEEVGPGFLF